MPSRRFNPYLDWLGLPDTPADYYQLFSLQRGEQDPGRIRRAVSRTLSRLRNIQPGARQDCWRRLLEQLESAGACLLSAEHKRRYDASLVSDAVSPDSRHVPIGETQRSLAVGETIMDPMAPVDFGPTERSPGAAVVAPRAALDPDADAHSRPSETSAMRPPLSEHSVDSTSARRYGAQAHRIRKPRPAISRNLAYITTAICFVGVFAVFIALMTVWILPATEQREQWQASVPQSAADLPLRVGEAETGSMPQTAEAHAPASLAIDEPAPFDEHPPASLPGNPRTAVHSDPDASKLTDVVERDGPEAGDPTDKNLSADEINRLLHAAYTALARHDWSEADRYLQQAHAAAASLDLSERVERFIVLADYVRQYWQAYLDGVEGLAGSELLLSRTRAMVVEVNPEALVMRIEGRNRSYPREKLPDAVIMAIADHWFGQRADTTKVFRGAFMLVSDGFTLAQVRTEWVEAQRAGAQIDDLLLLLDELTAIGIAKS